jgi:shikimate dehydrogenase
MAISGTTHKVGLIGWPVGHSFSPEIHNAAFSYCKLDYIYVPLPVEPSQLEQAVHGLKALGFSGANVTIPHKIAVMEYLDAIDDTARLAGAVNTIVVERGKLIGYNTDARGFITALQQNGFAVHGKMVLLLGAGGAARAVLAGLSDSGVASVAVAARQASQAQQLVDLFPFVKVQSVLWPGNVFEQVLSQADFIIQATPIGMYPHCEAMPLLAIDKIKEAAVVCDLIYNPVTTKLLERSAAAGHPVLSGLSMLVEQAALAFEYWTGQAAPRQMMVQSARNLVLKNSLLLTKK